MNIYELLKKDHKNMAALLKKLDATTSRAPKTRKDLYERLKRELDLHTALEEAIFYPALKNGEETRAMTFEAFEEHEAVGDLLDELGSTKTNSEKWGARLTVLKRNVEHHVREEEGKLFKRAREVLNNQQAEALGILAARAKRRKEAAAAR